MGCLFPRDHLRLIRFCERCNDQVHVSLRIHFILLAVFLRWDYSDPFFLVSPTSAALGCTGKRKLNVCVISPGSTGFSANFADTQRMKENLRGTNKIITDFRISYESWALHILNQSKLLVEGLNSHPQTENKPFPLRSFYTSPYSQCLWFCGCYDSNIPELITAGDQICPNIIRPVAKSPKHCEDCSVAMYVEVYCLVNRWSLLSPCLVSDVWSRMGLSPFLPEPSLPTRNCVGCKYSSTLTSGL